MRRELMLCLDWDAFASGALANGDEENVTACTRQTHSVATQNESAHPSWEGGGGGGGVDPSLVALSTAAPWLLFGATRRATAHET